MMFRTTNTLALTSVLALSAISACSSSDSAGPSDVSWKDVIAKKVDATAACKSLLGAQDANSAKKVGASALASAPDSVEIAGDLEGDSGGKSGHGDINLRCTLNGSALRFYPTAESDEMTTDTSVVADGDGFSAEAHSGSTGPGMKAVLTSAVSHLKP